MPRRSPRSPRPACGRGCTGRPGRHRHRRPRCWRPTQHRIAGAGARGYRLHHLHLGHHRCAQGGGGHPPQRHPAAGVTGCRAGAGAGVDAVSFVGLRLLGVGDLGCAAAAVGGWWWCPIRWSRSPEDLHALLVTEQVSVLEPDAVGVLCAANRRRATARAGTTAEASDGGVRRRSA